MKKNELSTELTFNYILSKDFKVVFLICILMISVFVTRSKIGYNMWSYLQFTLRSFEVIEFAIGVPMLYETIKLFYLVYKNENYLLRYPNKKNIYNDYIKASIKIGLVIYLEYIIASICVSFFKGYTGIENIVDKNMYGLGVIDIVIVQIIRNFLFIVCMQIGTVLIIDKLKKKELVVITIVMIYILIPFSFFLQGNKVINFILPTTHLNTWGISKTFWGNILSDLIYYIGILIILFIIKHKNFSKSKII